MKKYTLFLTMLLLSVVGYSQVPRMILFEEFSGENCGPCAAVNPSVLALYEANQSKVFLLKYQVPIPSAGPIYNSTTAGGFNASTRGSFYGVNSAPWGQQDGQTIDPAQTSPNHPAYWKQTIIDARYASQSPISIKATHTFDASNTNVTYKYKIKNETSAAITGTYNVYVTMFEYVMKYDSTVGTNGEREFHHVARMMYPIVSGAASYTGTPVTLPAGGMTDSVTATVLIPAHVRSKAQLGFVVWVQNNTTKEVIQSGASVQVTPNNFADASLALTITQPTDLCATTTTPVIKIYNKGTKTITSADISYGLSSGTSQIKTYTGSLAAGDSATLTGVSAVTPLGYTSYNVITAKVKTVNGSADDDINNNSGSNIIFATNPTAISTFPLTQNFESLALGGTKFSNGGTDDFSGSMYAVDKTINSSLTQLLGAFGASNKSYRIRPFDVDSSYPFNIYLDKLNFTGFAANEFPQFNFSCASARLDATSNDRLVLGYSTDCGITWSTLFIKNVSDLATGADNSSAIFYPTTTQWRKDSMYLASVKGKSNVMFRLTYLTGNVMPGNCFYIDDISVSKVTVTNLPVLEDSVVSSLNVTSSTTTTSSAVTGTAVSLNAADSVIWEVTNVTVPSGWSLATVKDNKGTYTYPTVKKSSFKYNALGNNDLSLSFSHNKIAGYGYAIVKIYRKLDSAASVKNVKFSLTITGGVSPSPTAIMIDSFRNNVYSANTRPASDSISTYVAPFTNLKAGDKVTWKVTNISLASGWKLKSICDNGSCKNYPALNYTQSFNYSTAVGGNFLDVEIYHNRAVGYGFFNVYVYKNSGTDSSSTAKTVRFALLVSNSASLTIAMDDNDKVLHYFDGTIFVDKDFNKSDINVYDMSGKAVLSKKINGTTIEFKPMTKGTFIATILKDGLISKTRKFIVE